MTSYKKYVVLALMSSALLMPSMSAHARGTTNQTKATLAGAAAGAALTGALGGDGKSMLLGAAAGGLAGNAYAYHNKKVVQQEKPGYRRYQVSNKKHQKYKKHKKYRQYTKARPRHYAWD